MAVSVSVVICAYTEERWEDICSAVASVGQQTHPPCEMILVVDHNPELLARIALRLQHVQAIPNDGALGLADARNTGVAAARGDVVAFLDDDARADPQWLAALCRHYGDQQVLGVGGRVDPGWVGRRPSWFPPEFDWVVGCSYVGSPLTLAPVRNPIGANMSFRRAVFEQVGGFTTGLGRERTKPLGCEETEWCIRAVGAHPGHRVLMDPDAQVTHRVGPERATWSYFVRRCYAEGISKRRVTKLTGTRAGLSTERPYVLHTLVRGVATNARDAVTKREGAAALRAIAILVGLLVTSAGYVRAAFASGAPWRAEAQRTDHTAIEVINRTTHTTATQPHQHPSANQQRIGA